MKNFYLTVILLTTFSLYLWAIPASPYLITFAQPDGSTFQAHITQAHYFQSAMVKIQFLQFQAPLVTTAMDLELLLPEAFLSEAQTPMPQYLGLKVAM